MEIKGNKAHLDKYERKRTGYSGVIDIDKDYIDLAVELDQDVNALTQLRADDGTSSYERAKSLITYEKLAQRRLMLDRILLGAGVETQVRIMNAQMESHLGAQPTQ